MRLFLALELPELERRRLDGHPHGRRWFAFEAGRLNWVRPENLHITLKFLGDVEEARLAELQTALRLLRVDPLVLRTEEVAFLPPRGPLRVLVARVCGDVQRLSDLHARVETALEPLGFAREARSFTPHVTLARVRRDRHLPKGIRQLLVEQKPPPGDPFTVDSFALFQSHLKPGGSEYVPLARFGRA